MRTRARTRARQRARQWLISFRLSPPALWRAARRTCGELPATLLEQRVPVPKAHQSLEYDIYGKFKFEHEPSGVYALGGAWVPIEQVAAVAGWSEKEDDYAERVVAEREPFE